jgi:hypothetical protein
MQHRWIAATGKRCPLLQSIKDNIHVVRSITPLSRGTAPHKMGNRIEAEDILRPLNEHSIDVVIIGSINLAAVQLRAANKGVDNVVSKRAIARGEVEPQ